MAVVGHLYSHIIVSLLKLVDIGINGNRVVLANLLTRGSNPLQQTPGCENYIKMEVSYREETGLIWFMIGSNGGLLPMSRNILFALTSESLA
jgi:hypothetical protein